MRGVILLASLVLAVMPASAEEADYVVSGGDLPVAAASNGFVQEIRRLESGGVEVHVATALAPIGAVGTYGDVLRDARTVVPLGFELPQRLETVLRPEMDSWHAATAVLEWAAENIVVDTTDAGPQDADSVLTRGVGRCSGLANAAVALLMAAGYQARTISGVLVGSDGDMVPHRWLECRLPGAGWVASDPTLGLWAVTPRHLVFADTVMSMPQIRVVTIDGDGLDRLPARRGRSMRPNRGADLVCRLRDAASQESAVAVLRGGGGEVRRALLDPEARFAGLLPGIWVLEVETPQGVVERRELELRAGDVRVYTVQAIEPRLREESES